MIWHFATKLFADLSILVKTIMGYIFKPYDPGKVTYNNKVGEVSRHD